MKKITILFLTFSFTLFGMSYAKLKEHTLKHSSELKSQALSLAQNRVEHDIRLRIENPTLGLALHKFDTDFKSNDYGVAASVSQKLRTSSYLESLEDESHAKRLMHSARVSNGRAGYIKTLEIRYTEYVYECKRIALVNEEQKLSRKLTAIVKEHYENGSENRVAYLQAKTETLQLQTEIPTIKRRRDKRYYELLAMAGFSENITLEKKFIYANKIEKSRNKKLTSKEKILLAKEKLLATQVRRNESMFESYEVSVGIEKEPDESILTFGFSVPLPFNHQKEEEKALAKLKMQQLSLDKKQLALALRSNKNILKNSIKELIEQHRSLQILHKEQLELSRILTKGYEIAQTSLFSLMQEKSKLIQTKKSLLEVVKMINTYKIELRFLEGAYNE